MRRSSLLLAAAVALSGCSLLDVPPPTNSSNGIVIDPTKQMSATIDGIAWIAQGVAIEQSASTIKFTGVLNFGQPSERAIILQFQRGVSGTQTFGEVGGVYAQVSVGNSSLQTWATKAGGPTGTVNVSVISSNHVIGVFSFDAAGNFNDLVPAVRKVTQGSFDITF